MPIRRKFIDPSRPALDAACGFLLSQHHSGNLADLRNVLVVVPGRRVGRRLLEILVTAAGRESLVLTPPRIETVGRLPEHLYPQQRPLANDLVQTLAWLDVLKRVSLDTIAPFVPTPPDPEETSSWLELAELLRRQHTELAGDGLDFADVERQAPADEARRWRAMRILQKSYLRRLDALQLWDVQTARLVAIQQRECHATANIVLVGTADMNVATRQMLDQVADQVTVLVFASDTCSDRFDQYGCLVPEKWQDLQLHVDTQRVHVVDGPSDQADAVARIIASFEGRFRVDEITVGVPDNRIVPQIERQLQAIEVPSRWGPGRAIQATPPYQLLAAVAAYVQSNRFKDFAALVRHTDVSTWIDRHGFHDHWLSKFDVYHNECLPSQLGKPWPENSSLVQQIHELISQLLREFSDPNTTRPLNEWMSPLHSLLLSIYGHREVDRDDTAGRMCISSCMRIRDAISILGDVPPSLAPRVSAADAIDLVARQLKGETVSFAETEAAVELLGWLELPLDDTPALIVSCFNEGYVPRSVNSDLFLPNRLRSQLGLLDNDRRYARDAYALSVMLASRQRLEFIVARRDINDDPLMPSRLLFATDPETTARRTLDFLKPPAPQSSLPPLAGALKSDRDTSDFAIPEPLPLDKPMTRLSATGFRAYLACPYRFYLKRVLYLEGIDDGATELDGAFFGTLIHEVLRRFGCGPVHDSTDADEIREQLHRELITCTSALCGDRALPAVEVQIEQMRSRLNEFANRQAAWCESGWQIRFTEDSDRRQSTIWDVDGSPFEITGRIDRIDVHRETGECAILDYKSSDFARPPERVHRPGGQWVDLQLPLYRHLARTLGFETPMTLGYILLPRDKTKMGFHFADWSENELEQADEIARGVIRNVRAEKFWPPVDPPPDYSDELAAICQDHVFDRSVISNPIAMT